MRTFLLESLKIDFMENFDKRMEILKNTKKQKFFENIEFYCDTFLNAIAFYPQLLLLSGNQPQTLYLAQALAKILAIPVCLQPGLDKSEKSAKQEEKREESLCKILAALSQHFGSGISPKVVLVATSLFAVMEWVKQEIKPENFENLEKIFMISSQNNAIPLVFVAGFEKKEGQCSWIVDLPLKEHF
jgi:hypothetical protein